MTTRIPIRWLMAAAVAVAAWTAVAWAAPPAAAHSAPHGEWMLERLAERLELSDAQVETLRGLWTAHREQMAPLHEQAIDLEEVLEAAIHAEDFDEGALRAAARQLADARVELAVARARFGQEIRQVLTPEQRAEMRELHERRRELRGRGFGWHEGPGFGHGRHGHGWDRGPWGGRGPGGGPAPDGE